MRFIHRVAVVALLLGAWPAAAEEKVVIPFDFVSKWDNGTLGQQVGEMVWAKLNREKGFVVPESMTDVRDFCAGQGLKIGPDSDLAKVKQAVTGDFGAQIGVWGSVERAPGTDRDVYDLVIKCYDFSAEPPRKIYEVTARTNTAHEVPHLYVKNLMDALYERQPSGPAPPNEFAEQNWLNNPNLIVGGDFERGYNGVPYGWEPRGGQEREPLGRLVQWIDEVGASKPGKVIRLTMDKALGDSIGVMYYSKAFPIDDGATYRLQCRWRSSGPAAKIFVKVYGDMLAPSEYRAEGEPATQPQAPSREYEPRNMDQAREAYRSQQNLKGPKNTWNAHSEDFTPRHTKYDLRFGRLELYGYLGAGAVEFDDFVVKQIIPASPGEKANKARKQSIATRVTLKEMEENERRSREAAEAEKQQKKNSIRKRKEQP